MTLDSRWQGKRKLPSAFQHILLAWSTQLLSAQPLFQHSIQTPLHPFFVEGRPTWVEKGVDFDRVWHPHLAKDCRWDQWPHFQIFAAGLSVLRSGQNVEVPVITVKILFETMLFLLTTRWPMQVLLTATTRLSREHAAVRNFKTIIVFSRIPNNAGLLYLCRKTESLSISTQTPLKSRGHWCNT